MGTPKSMNDWLSRLQTSDTAGTPDRADRAEEDQKNFIPLPHGSDTSAKRDSETTSVTVGTAAGEGCEVFAEPLPRAPEVVMVTYQRIFFDWAVADGTYTPQQLRKAPVVAKPWGPVQTYPLAVEIWAEC
jgi:hypothetical protein